MMFSNHNQGLFLTEAQAQHCDQKYKKLSQTNVKL